MELKAKGIGTIENELKVSIYVLLHNPYVLNSCH